MKSRTLPGSQLDPKTREFYQASLRLLKEADLPFLVGGAYSFARYTGIERHTKDFDVFVRPEDCTRVLKTLEEAGCKTDLTFPHWLGKAHNGENFIDVIYSSGNGIVRVDDGWFEHAVEEVVLDIPVLLCPAEETIWSKAFVMERERYDGADIAHLLRASAREMDWKRLLARFGPHWRVLMSHLILFGFIYPTDRDIIPQWVTDELIQRLQRESATPGVEKVCQGTLFSRAQYLVDIEHWGYHDARLLPEGAMTPQDVAHWTAAIEDSKPTEAVRPTLGNDTH